jgi:negative regulator of flagellin synthesis FlgM
MNSVDTRSPFFPRSKSNQTEVQKARANEALKRNSYDRAQEIETKTSKDAKVSINDKIKDFSRIKKSADSAQPIDNSAKIAMLKAKIQAGTYEPDYDQLADKILSSEY